MLIKLLLTIHSDDDNQNTEENSELDIEHEGYLTLNELGTVLVDLGLRGKYKTKIKN